MGSKFPHTNVKAKNVLYTKGREADTNFNFEEF